MRNFFIKIACFFLVGCGSFEFVYQKNNEFLSIKDCTSIFVSGDNYTDIYSILNDLIGDKKDGDEKLFLNVESSKTILASVISKDATASEFTVEFVINYELYTKNKAVFSTEIETLNSYQAKSEGYSFSTDLSEKDSIILNINNNVNEFLSSLMRTKDLEGC